MTSGETDSKASTSDTHQVLGLAVGLGVGIPVVLVLLVMWFVTVRHRRMAKAEDERHKAIDLDAEVSVSEEKPRRHRPVPGSMTYLAKQHAASQRSLNKTGQNNSSSEPSLPNGRHEYTLSMVSHDSHSRPPESLIYTPYAQEEASSSLDNLTRDLNNLDAPKYPRIQGLRSSGSSSSLNRDDRSYLTYMSDTQSVDGRFEAPGRSGIHAPLPGKKIGGPGNIQSSLRAPKESSTPPRLEDSRVPSTLREEEEYPRKSPFEDDDAFSFDDDTGDLTGGRNSASSFQTGDENGTFDQSLDMLNDSSVLDDNRIESSTHRRQLSLSDSSPSNDNSYGSANAEDQLMVNNSHTGSIYEDSTSIIGTPPPQTPAKTTNTAPLGQNIIPDGSFRDQELHRSTSSDASMHTSDHEEILRPRNPKLEPRVVSSVYDHPAVASYFINNGTQNTSQSSDWQPATPQTQTEEFDYHLESSPLSPSSPLHSVPSIVGISRIHTNGSAPNSRKGSMSEFMHDVPHINQSITGAPGSPKHVKRKRSNQKGSPVITSDAHFDSAVFLEKPKKFGNRASGKQRLPSASQMGI